MKTDKNKFKENLLEGIFELVFTAIFFGIGAGGIHLFGKLFKLDLDVSSMDLDGVALLGIVVLVIIFWIVGIWVDIIKKRMKKQ